MILRFLILHNTNEVCLSISVQTYHNSLDFKIFVWFFFFLRTYDLLFVSVFPFLNNKCLPFSPIFINNHIFMNIAYVCKLLNRAFVLLPFTRIIISKCCRCFKMFLFFYSYVLKPHFLTEARQGTYLRSRHQHTQSKGKNVFCFLII